MNNPYFWGPIFAVGVPMLFWYMLSEDRKAEREKEEAIEIYRQIGENLKRGWGRGEEKGTDRRGTG